MAKKTRKSHKSTKTSKKSKASSSQVKELRAAYKIAKGTYHKIGKALGKATGVA